MDEFLKNELDRLRDKYITATPQQRLHIIEQRLNNHDSNPNKLVTHVASVESLARTLVINSPPKTNDELRNIYKKYRYTKVENLIREYLRINKFSKAPDLFGEETWRTFRRAVEYRNLLIHECTALGSVKYVPLEEATQKVLNKLIEVAEIKSP